MQFLAPWFWIAAAAVALPIFLHLTRREEKRSRPFASLMFFRRIPVHEFRRRRVRNLLLLLLRCAALLLLAAAFSRPLIEQFASSPVMGGGNRSVVVLVDRSYSMSRPGIDEQLRDGVSRLAATLGVGDEATLVYFSRKSEVAVPWTSDFGRIVTSADSAASDRFDRTSLAAGIAGAAAQLESARNPKRALVVFTDLQAGGDDLEAANVELPSGVEVQVRDVGDEAINYYLEVPALDRTVYSGGLQIPVVVRVLASGGSSFDAAGQEGELRLYEGDRLLQSHAFVFGTERSVKVELEPLELEDGIHRLRLETTLADGMPEDNRAYLVVERGIPFEVRLAVGNGSSEGAAFLADALSSGPALPFRVQRGDRASWAGLGRGSVVLLVNPGPESAASARDYLERGGGLLVVPDAAASVFFSDDRAGRLMPGRLLERVFAPSGSGFFSISETAVDHWIFSPFRLASDGGVGSARFFGYWKIQPAAQAKVLARFTSGDPALVESESGGGRILLFASTLDRAWTDFPLRGAFVPFWQQAVLYAAQWKARPAGLEVGQSPALDPGNPGEAEPGIRLEILDPDGRRVTRLGEEGVEHLLFSKPGYYETRSGGKTDWIAVNTVPAESDLTRTGVDRIESEIMKLQGVQPAKEIAPADGSAGKPATEVWWVLVLLAVAVFLLEGFLANRSQSRTSDLVGERLGG